MENIFQQGDLRSYLIYHSSRTTFNCQNVFTLYSGAGDMSDSDALSDLDSLHFLHPVVLLTHWPQVDFVLGAV